MIFTESTITISNNNAKINSPIVLYRGDKNVEIRFTILQSPFKYSNTVATNVIESTNASYGQLVIKTPNDKPPIFSEVSATKEGTVLFTITKEMIDEIEEVGAYTFQIRLMDENKQSRVTIPPVENGIEIKEPIAIEDDNSTNVVGLAKANYAVATSSDVDTPTFDDNGKYIKTNWNDGDIITNASLNKIEDGIYTTNENVTATKKYVDDDINYNNKQFNNKISAIHMSRHPVSCSTEIYKKPLCDIFPELLNITYNTVFKEFNSFKVNMDNFAKEYPTVKSAYNKLNINLYDENDNSIGNSYGNSINGEGLNIIFINITESLRFYAYFDKALVDGSDTTMETKNGYMTIQLLIPKGNNKQEFIDKIKNLKLTLSVFRVDFLNLNNETIYTPTTDYHPATKKYVDDNTPIKSLPVNPTTKTGAVVDVNNITVSGCYALPKRSDGAHWTNLMMRAMINDGSGKGKSIMLSGYQNFVFHVNIESKKIYCDNLRIVYNIGTTADTTDIRTEPYYLPTTNTKEYAPTNDYNPATKKYVDDNILLEQLPILRVDETNKRIYVNCNNMGTYKKYFVPNKYANAYGFSFIYTNEDKSETEIALIGGAMTRDDFILCARNTNTLFILILGGTDKYTYTKSTKTLEKGLYGYLKIGNTQEYTPTNDYNPATKKYVDDIKTGIDGIKADLGTAQLTTTAKDVKGAVNEVNAQCKDIAKVIELDKDCIYNRNSLKNLTKNHLNILQIGDSIATGTGSTAGNFGFFQMLRDTLYSKNNGFHFRTETTLHYKFSKYKWVNDTTGLFYLYKTDSNSTRYDIFDSAKNLLPTFDYTLYIYYSTRPDGGVCNITDGTNILGSVNCQGEIADCLVQKIDVSANKFAYIEVPTTGVGYINGHSHEKKNTQGHKIVQFTKGGAKISDLSKSVLEASLNMLDFDILMLDFMANDWSQNAYDDFVDRVTAITTKAKEKNIDVIYCITCGQKGTETGEGLERWNKFKKFIYDLAITNNFCIIDYDKYFKGYENFNSNGLLADTVHPNDSGHNMMANVLCNLILNQNCINDAGCSIYSSDTRHPAYGLMYNKENMNFENNLIVNNLKIQQANPWEYGSTCYVQPIWRHYSKFPSMAQIGTITSCPDNSLRIKQEDKNWVVPYARGIMEVITTLPDADDKLIGKLFIYENGNNQTLITYIKYNKSDGSLGRKWVKIPVEDFTV